MQPQKIAEERIEILFGQAEEKFDEDPDLADRYVEIARSIGERTQTSLKKELKMKYCSGCGSFWQPGASCTVDINTEKSSVLYRCNNCGETEEYAY
jgi:RNase P subunit RPR2